MAKPRAILQRKKAVQNIAKITKTMQMIATAKFKRAFNRAVAARPYTDRLKALIAELSAAAGEYRHPLLETREPKRAAVLAIASNRGLCGGYNSNVLKLLAQHRAEMERRGVPLEVFASGKKLGGMLKYQRVEVARLFSQFEDKPTFAQVDELVTAFLRRWEAGEVDALHVVYTKFLSSARQHAVVEQVLPVMPPAPAEGSGGAAPKSGRRHLYLYDPDPATILDALVPRGVRLHVFQAFLDAAVSEQTARMVAMKSATDNAFDMIDTLTRRYNRSRQTLITTELSEIMGGAAALE
jgi:F-type H+-transporting ATPase subunit gamma